jgi:Putative phage tail protein
MSFLRTAKKQASVTPDYTGLQLQTSVNTLPVPIVWGRTKISANILWYQNFKAVPQYSKSSGKGGSHKTVTGYSYQADLILGLAEGPINTVGTVWRDQSTYTLAQLGLTLFNGATPQAAWGYLRAAYPNQTLAYQGTSFVCAAGYALGDEASIGNHNFELVGLLAGTGVNNLDADPSLVISDFLISPQYGLGFDGASIDATTLFGASGDASLQTYCRAMGICFSPALTDQEQASSILTRWLQIVNCAAVWSGGRMKFVPYGDVSLTGNGYTFNPDSTPIYDLNDDNFIAAGGNEDPVHVSRLDPFSLPSLQRIEVSARDNQYGMQTVEARDQSQIELYGPRVGSTITAHEICDPALVGATVAQIILQRGLYVRAHFTFKLSWEYCLLDPMDIVTVTDANLGLARTPVRITAIEEDDNGVLTVTAEELVLGVSTPSLYPTQTPAGASLNQGITPDPVNPPLIFEPPPALTGGVPQLWVGASGGAGGLADPNWGGAYVWVSTDNVTYTQVATIVQPMRQGTLLATLPAVSGWDPSSKLSVTLAECGGQLDGTTVTSAQQGVTLALVDGELLAYETATLAAQYQYNLTGLQRGMYGTPPAAHVRNAPFYRLDESIVRYNLPQNYLGVPLFLKMQGFNVFFSGL